MASFLDGDGVAYLWRKIKEAIKGITAADIGALSSTDTTLSQSGQAADAKVVGDTLLPLLNGTAGSHNAVYRGDCLGSVVTTEQYNAIANGTFDNMYIGDYWTIDGIEYYIAGFDYYLFCGDQPCYDHHVVLVPGSELYNAKMNDTENSTAGGYAGSDMYTNNLEAAKTTIKNAFSGHVLKHRISVSNAVTNGYPSGNIWVNSEVDLMSEKMVYGSSIMAPMSDGYNIPANYNYEKTQLPLFLYAPHRITIRRSWWLRDVASAYTFASIQDYGYAGSNYASYSLGVRPAFCIY